MQKIDDLKLRFKKWPWLDLD